MTVLPKDLAELEEELMQLEDPVEKAEHASGGQGFVKKNITYIVTDSLEIMPPTSIRSINVLNKLHIPTLADLESTDITITITEVCLSVCSIGFSLVDTSLHGSALFCVRSRY